MKEIIGNCPKCNNIVLRSGMVSGDFGNSFLRKFVFSSKCPWCQTILDVDIIIDTHVQISEKNNDKCR